MDLGEEIYLISCSPTIGSDLFVQAPKCKQSLIPYIVFATRAHFGGRMQARAMEKAVQGALEMAYEVPELSSRLESVGRFRVVIRWLCHKSSGSTPPQGKCQHGVTKPALAAE